MRRSVFRFLSLAGVSLLGAYAGGLGGPNGAGGGLGVSQAHAASPPPAQTVLTNGYIYTVNTKNSVAQAIAVRDGTIVYVGTDKGARRFIGPATQVTDLHGHMVMPGLVDGHMHPLDGGRLLISCSLNYEALTIPQFQARISACLKDPKLNKPQGWLIATSWFQEAMQPAGTVLTKAALDAVDAKTPIIVKSSFFHSFLLNSAALKRAGITASTKAPPGGSIIHDKDGNPTGLLEDTAVSLVDSVLPAPTAEEDKTAAAAALAAMRKQGITTFLDAWALDPALTAFTTLQKQGQLTARAHFAVWVDPKDGADVPKVVSLLKTQAARYDQGPVSTAPSITVRNAKLFMDGVISAPALTGVVLDPYFVNKGTAEHPDWQPGTSRGPAPYFPPEVLAPLLLGITQAGFDPHMHADGDGAVRIALDAIETARKADPKSTFRPAIAHDEMVSPADRGRYKPLDTVAVLSFQWEKPGPDTVDSGRDYLGPQRFADMEPAALLEQTGTRIAYGSDWPVDKLNEWFALKVGATRKNAPDISPQYAGQLGTQPPLSRASVLRAITMNSSWELQQDKQTGSLEPGKLADLIILDRNVMQVPVDDIANTQVLLTMVGGKVVYSTGAFAPATDGPATAAPATP